MHCALLYLLYLPLIYSEYSENIYLGLTNHFYQSLFDFKFGQNITRYQQPDIINYGFFPPNIADILMEYSIQHLEISFAQSKWNKELWGKPLHDVPPGIMIYIEFRIDKSNYKNTNGKVLDMEIERKWHSLLNLLSGMFCGSMGTSALHYSINPETLFTKTINNKVVKSNRNCSVTFSYISRLAILPHETMCTENLSPWKKMLPCKKEAGLVRLLNEIVWFAKPFVSLRIVATSTPNIINSSRTKDSISHFTTLDTTLTLLGSLDTKRFIVTHPGINIETLFKELYGRNTDYVCTLATSTNLYLLPPNVQNLAHPVKGFKIDLGSDRNDSRENEILVKFFSSGGGGDHLPGLLDYFNETANHRHKVNRFLTGYGRCKGQIVTKITKVDGIFRKDEYRLKYLQIIPWYIYTYVHTLRVMATDADGTSVTLDDSDYDISYRPSRKISLAAGGGDRGKFGHRSTISSQSPSILIIGFSKPEYAQKNWTGLDLILEIRYRLLPWYEYPPDGNHGFYLPSGVLTVRSTVLPSSNGSYRVQTDSGPTVIYDEPLLLILPTPDFSMPYNVLCLSCTLLALSYGSIFNLTSKVICLKTPSTQKWNITTLLALISSFIRRLKERFRTKEIKNINLLKNQDSSGTIGNSEPHLDKDQ